jgi:hypothetical protein
MWLVLKQYVVVFLLRLSSEKFRALWFPFVLLSVWLCKFDDFFNGVCSTTFTWSCLMYAQSSYHLNLCVFFSFFYMIIRLSCLAIMVVAAWWRGFIVGFFNFPRLRMWLVGFCLLHSTTFWILWWVSVSPVYWMSLYDQIGSCGLWFR